MPTYPALIVCPDCCYGFVPRGQSGELVCPRAECGHRWQVVSQTSALIHGHERREAVPEIHILKGALRANVVIPEGESTIGRAKECLCRLENISVLPRHARIVRSGEHALLENLGDPSSVLVNGKPVLGTLWLKVGDRLVIAGIIMDFAVRFENRGMTGNLVDNSLLIAQGGGRAPWVAGEEADVICLAKQRITFGRSPDRDVVLPSGLVSTRHAVLEEQGDDWFLSDTQSRIGSFVNGKGIIRCRLAPGDRIQLGPFLFRFEGRQLVRMRKLTTLELVAVGVGQVVGKVRLLEDVSLIVKPGEFVGVLGPSGAGKSTLLDALNGLRPAGEGGVFVNGESLYDNFEQFRPHIGYVPQDDIIHRELTTRQALAYAARLRLAKDLSEDEVSTLVEETLAALDLTERAGVPIWRLSGGQRKRASVGVELLSRPGILFLDEPTSGLDPATEARLMRKLRQLANQGRTIVCTTHVMENVELFDRVLILVPGGRTAYFGSPAQAKEYFNIAKFTSLYEKLEEKPPEKWMEEYRESESYQRTLAPLSGGKLPRVSRRRRPLKPPCAGFGAQAEVLMRRYCRILAADGQNLALLAAQPLVITGLICLVCRDLPLIFFLLVVAALWFGCSLAAQQIIKELPIYRRERMVNLRLDCYVASKSIPLAAVTTTQCLLMLGLVRIFRGAEHNFLLQFLTLTLASWNGLAIGLIISALASNGDKALTAVPLTLLPQIILAGVLVPLPDMSLPTRLASCLMASRWANQALEVSVLHGKTIDRDLLSQDEYVRPLWNLHPAYELRKEEGRVRFLSEWGGTTVESRNALALSFIVLTAFVIGQLYVVGRILARQDPF